MNQTAASQSLLFVRCCVPKFDDVISADHACATGDEDEDDSAVSEADGASPPIDDVLFFMKFCFFARPLPVGTEKAQAYKKQKNCSIFGHSQTTATAETETACQGRRHLDLTEWSVAGCVRPTA